jgi:hypothetical protein
MDGIAALKQAIPLRLDGYIWRNQHMVHEIPPIKQGIFGGITLFLIGFRQI